MADLLVTPPDLDLDDDQVIDDLGRLRVELAAYLRVPRRWDGSLRRSGN